MKDYGLQPGFYRGGSSLVMVLWIFVLLVVITVVVAQTSRVDTRITSVMTDQLRCKWACRAGLETAIAILNDDEPESDSLEDYWADNPDYLQDVELDGCSYSVAVTDESSKLNINNSNVKMLMYLPDMTEEIANAIVDWRDKDDEIRTGSAEAGYYLNMPHPYKIRNKGFRTIRELLRVKGVTEELFYGKEGNGSGSSEFAESFEAEEGYQAGADEDLQVNEGWINYLTCYSLQKNERPDGTKRIDINKASEKKLVDELGIKQVYAKWIVENRKDGFKNLASLISNSSPDKPKNSSGNSKKGEPLDVKTVLDIADKVRLRNRKYVRGRVNVNTAGKIVLTALLRGNERAAEDIITYRESRISGIESLGELMDIESLKKNDIKKIIDSVSVRSDIYMVRSFARAELTDTSRHVEAVVDRKMSPALLVYFCQGARF